MEKDLVHNESLLDLLTRQQTRGEPGVRLSFHQDLLSPVSFFLSPLHYAAVTGNTALACYLHSEEGEDLNRTKAVTVASFAAGGRNGRTSWKIPVTVTPSQAASLAGHAITAKALKYFESGIPLTWDRKHHRKFKISEFKHESRKLMSSLLEFDWFYALPGPARMRLTDDLMTHLARVHVWGFLDDRIWKKDWENLVGKDVWQAITNIRSLSPSEITQPRQQNSPPLYQFSVGHVNDQVRRRRYVREMFRFVRRGVCGTLWWLLNKSNVAGPPLMTTLGIFIAVGSGDLLLPFVLRIFGDSANA